MHVPFQSCNPRTQEVLRTFELLSHDAVEKRVLKVASAQKKWRLWAVAQRAKLLASLGTELEQKCEFYASLIEIEMGKLRAEAIAEVRKCADLCRYLSTEGPKSLQTQSRIVDGAQVRVEYEPLGVILAVMPWNFPFWQFFRAAAPALLSGNAVLLKHAPNTPQCALAIEELFTQVIPDLAIVCSLFIDNEQVRALIGHKAVRGVTLTGSKSAGIAVASAAAEAVKPCVLELGGSDPFIVFPDAELEKTVSIAVNSRCLSNGQSCIAAKRFLVHQDISEEFLERMSAQMSKRILGPLANQKQQFTLHAQVEDALELGAVLHCGGEIPEGLGFFYPPTVLSNLNASMRVSREEVFGPVACVWKFADEAEALELANATDFGLGAALFTKNENRIAHFSRYLECGQVFVNDFVRSDPRFPFGGIKESGFGRELGERAPLAFTNEKTVYVRAEPSHR